VLNKVLTRWLAVGQRSRVATARAVAARRRDRAAHARGDRPPRRALRRLLDGERRGSEAGLGLYRRAFTPAGRRRPPRGAGGRDCRRGQGPPRGDASRRGRAARSRRVARHAAWWRSWRRRCFLAAYRPLVGEHQEFDWTFDAGWLAASGSPSSFYFAQAGFGVLLRGCGARPLLAAASVWGKSITRAAPATSSCSSDAPG
jgi:hypothetical protein